jgi:hypothetical protein
VVDFWKIIGSNSVESSDEVKSALDRVAGRLGELEPGDLVDFVEKLHENLYRIDRRELAEIPVILAGGLRLPQTSDHFLHVRCACILAGRDEYEASLASSDTFTRFVKPYALAAEGLLHIASNVYENKFGGDLEVASGYPVESMSNLQGWEGFLVDTESRKAAVDDLLMGSSFRAITRAANMGMIEFLNPQGSIVAVHIQCPYRILQGRKVILGSGDMNFAEAGAGAEAFDQFGTVFDSRVAVLNDILKKASPKVLQIVFADSGWVALECSGTFVLEIFPDCSGKVEAWRVFERGRAEHYGYPHKVI